MRHSLCVLASAFFLATGGSALAVTVNVEVESGGTPVSEAEISFETVSGEPIETADATGTTDQPVEPPSTGGQGQPPAMNGTSPQSGQDDDAGAVLVTGDDGRATGRLRDSYKGKTVVVVVKRGDQVTRKQVALTGDDNDVSIVVPPLGSSQASNGTRAPSMYGEGFYYIPGTDERMTVNGEYPSRCEEGFFYIPGTDTCLRISGYTRYKFSLDFAASSTDADYGINTSFGNFSGNGDDTFHSIGADFRANLARLGNAPVDVFAGAWGRLNLSGNDQNLLELNLHPTPGDDTHAFVSTDGFIMPYVGLGTDIDLDGYANLGESSLDLYLSGYVGLRLERHTLRFVTDETGGGGQVNEFEDSNIRANVTIGADLDISPKGSPYFGRLGVAYDFMSSASLSDTSAVLGNNYDVEADLDDRWRVILGAGVNF